MGPSVFMLAQRILYLSFQKFFLYHMGKEVMFKEKNEGDKQYPPPCPMNHFLQDGQDRKRQDKQDKKLRVKFR
jgi:hypothetical protein